MCHGIVSSRDSRYLGGFDISRDHLGKIELGSAIISLSYPDSGKLFFSLRQFSKMHPYIQRQEYSY